MKQVRAIGDREGEGSGKALPTLEVQEGGRNQAESEIVPHCHAFLPFSHSHWKQLRAFFVRFLKDET